MTETCYWTRKKPCGFINGYIPAQAKPNLRRGVNFYSHLSGTLICLHFRTCFTTLSALRLWAWEAATDVIAAERGRGKPESVLFSGRFTDPRPAGLDRGVCVWRDTSYLHYSLFTLFSARFICSWSRTLKMYTVQQISLFIFVIIISSLSQVLKALQFH